MIRSWLDSSKIYLEPRVLAVVFLGFSSGLPLLLVYSTLSAWLEEAGVSLTAIGFFSWASGAYALKFIWAPVVDRVRLPLLAGALGQRRSWLLLSQAAVAATMVGLGLTDPAVDPWWTAFWAVLLGFSSATQDIVVDAFRVESLDEERWGAGAANYVFGYRVAMLAAGGGALILAEFLGWAAAYGAMAVLMGVGMATTLMSREPTVQREPGARDFLSKAREAVISPFAEFMSRPHWIAILAFVALYKYGEALLGVMANPFYLQIGFSKAEIGVVSKVFGLGMTLVGAFIGGVLVARVGILRALLYAGIPQCIANLAFALQAVVGASVPMLMVTISIENVTAAMATSAFVAYISSLCNLSYTATQFALLTSMMNFARIVFASGGGWLAERMDWASYFIVTTFAAVPGLLILLWLMRKERAEVAASTA